jgi:hypothetical protein
MVAEMGVIELIEMFDFMCHRHLKVPFGPKINFIIGHNGSAFLYEYGSSSGNCDYFTSLLTIIFTHRWKECHLDCHHGVFGRKG